MDAVGAGLAREASRTGVGLPRAKSSASCTARVARQTWRRRSSARCRCALLAPSSPTRTPSRSLTAALHGWAHSAEQATLDVMLLCRAERCLAASHDAAHMAAMERSVLATEKALEMTC